VTEPFVPLDTERLLKTLYEHRVQFIVIGGIAAIAHGSSMVTRDLDICYERGMDNLRALAAALQALGARLRGVPEDVPFRLDARTLQMGDHFTFITEAGEFDCLGVPAGTDGYPDLIQKAVDVEFGDLTVKVTALDDLIRMKRAADRPKDRFALEILGALRDEIDGVPE
jgi:hypothetical protein